jgi:hypothetical protein
MSKSPAARMTPGNCITDAQIRAEIQEGDALQGVDRRAQQYIAALHLQRRGVVLRFVWHELRVYAILRLPWLYRHVSSSTPTCPSATLAIEHQRPPEPGPAVASRRSRGGRRNVHREPRGVRVDHRPVGEREVQQSRRGLQPDWSLRRPDARALSSAMGAQCSRGANLVSRVSRLGFG